MNITFETIVEKLKKEIADKILTIAILEAQVDQLQSELKNHTHDVQQPDAPVSSADPVQPELPLDS